MKDLAPRKTRIPPTKEQEPPSGARAILLTRGWVAWVDEDDYEELSRSNWFVSGSFYALRHDKGTKNRCVQMHNQIMGLSSFEVDHINHKRNLKVVDNRRFNLRRCTVPENRRNSKKRPFFRSPFKGVFKVSPKSKRWGAKIRVGGKQVYLGSFAIEVYAAYVYDLASVKHFGNFARTNFPIPGSISSEFS